MERTFEFKCDVSLFEFTPGQPFFRTTSQTSFNMVVTKAPVAGSFLSRLMARTSADAADVFRYLFDDRNDADDRCLLLDGHNDHDDYSTDDSTFGNFWHSQYFVSDDKEDEAPAPPPPTSPVRKKKRTSYARKPQSESTWSRDYLIPTLRESYVIKPHGRDAKKFRRLFRVPYDLFVVLVGLCKERWWTDWTPEKVDAAGKLVSNLELKVLGALYVLGTGASQHQVGVQTNISEEVHRCFFLAWISKKSSIQKEYIFMPTNDEQFERVVGEYSTLSCTSV